MITPALAYTAMWVIISISMLLMLIRPRNIPETYWISAGVLLLLSFRLITPQLALHAAAKAIDVCLFLIGMMLLSELAREHGVFDWLSSLAMRAADGSCSRLFALVYIVGTVVTIFMSNDATAVVLTPAILTAVRKTKVQPLPYLFVCAFVANAASFLLPISNPANLVVFQGAMPPLASWLIAFAVPSLLSIVTTFLVLRFLLRKELCESIEQRTESTPLNTNGKLVLVSVGIMVAVLLTASSLGKQLGLPTCLTALAITAVLCIKEHSNPLALAREISWSTLVLVAGLFVMVDAAESAGAMDYTKECLLWTQHLGLAAGEFVAGFAVGIGNNLVNNLPLGLLVGSAVHAAHASRSMAAAVLIGVDLGPNLSITGSLATILWLIALRREKLDVTFLDFLKVGAIAMPIALIAALCGSILMKVFFGIS
ncbi:MAG TPA: arsenic transporter [Candidatus Aquilonibacter sp.]|nr:arsenic transporter [Candidatus Aquilonibacter sp.]